MNDSDIIGIYTYGNLKKPEIQIEAIGKAGFNVMVISTFHVHKDGTLYNTPPLNLKEYLVNFKSKYNGKVYCSIGNAAGSKNDMTNLESLLSGYSPISKEIQPANTGFGTLVRSLRKLMKDLPIDGIDFDFEPQGQNSYNSKQKTMVSQFTSLLHSLGFGVTYCPYEEPQFWIEAQVDSCDPAITGKGISKVNWWNLQCYDGGGGNTPNSWLREINEPGVVARMGVKDASRFVIPGYSKNQSTPGDVKESVETAAQGSPPSKGGAWIWDLNNFEINDHLESKLTKYAKAIKNGLA